MGNRFKKYSELTGVQKEALHRSLSSEYGGTPRQEWWPVDINAYAGDVQ